MRVDIIRTSHRAITIIEIVLCIIIFGVGIVPIMSMVFSVTEKHAQAEASYRAMVLGRDLLEEILVKKFDERSIKGTGWSELGPDTGETQKSDFDDVDDYNGYNDTPINGYTRRVSVNYVDPDTTPPTNCLNGDQDYPMDCYKDDNTLDYKRIDVEVLNDLIGEVYFSSVVSSAHD